MRRRELAVVLDGPPTPAWQVEALELLEDSPTLRVGEVRLVGKPRYPLGARIRETVERRLLALGPSALDPAAVPPRKRIEAGADALVVWLAEMPPPEDERRELLHARHGGRDETADTAFRRALLDDVGHLDSELVLRRAGSSLLVERTVSGVRPFSLALSTDLLLWKLAAMVRRACERAAGAVEPAPLRAPDRRPPSRAALLAHSTRAWTRVLGSKLLFRRPWSIRLRPIQRDPLRGWSEEPPLVRWGPSAVYADPFLFEHEGRHHLFCEDVPAGTTRGVISHTELPLDGGSADPPTPVLEASHHLSYPFVFRHRGEIFMIPETAAANRVELHRAASFPREWAHERNLLEDVRAHDATIAEHDGRLWLFASVAAKNASSLDELHVYWADALEGDWHAHPCNPVVSDVRGARPAGPLKHVDGRLIRPAQDGSRRYGWAISFREIELLTTTEYSEREVDRLEPHAVRGARATHHYSADDRYEAIDYRHRRRRWPRGRG